MPSLEQVRRVVTIEGRTTGIKEATADLNKMEGAYTGVTVATERMGAATISAESKLNTLQKRFDANYRAANEVAAAERTLAAARNQGLISAEREAALLGLVTAKYEQATVAARGYGAAVGFAGGLIGGFVGGAGLTLLMQLPHAIGDAIGSVGDLADAAQRAGASAEKLQILRGALEQNGGAAESADAALTAFNVRIGTLANTAGGPAADAIKSLGIHIRDAGGALKSNDELFRETIDKLHSIDDASRRSALAAQLFGKAAGPDLAGVIAIGTQGLDEQERRMRGLGQVMSNDMVAAGDKLDDKFAEWGRTWSTGFKTAVVGIADAMWTLADSFHAVSEQSSVPLLTSELFKVGAQRTAVATTLNSATAQRAGLGDDNPVAVMLDRQIADYRAQIKSLNDDAREILTRIDQLKAPLARASGGGQASDNDDLGYTLPAAPKTKLPNYIMSIVPQINEDTAAMDRFNDQLAEARAIGVGFTKDFFSGLERGVGIWQSLGNAGVSALQKIADKAIDMASNNLIDWIFGAFTGGLPSPVGAIDGAHGVGAVSTGYVPFGLNAKGNAYDSRGIVPFARGGIVDRPTFFPFAKGVGLMGEAGPEAIMPLMRHADGGLGVRAAGGGGTTVINHNITVDARGAAPGVGDEVHKAVAEALKNYDRALPDRMAQINRNPRKRG